MSFRILFSNALSLGLLTAAGCGGGPSLVSVEGTVTLDGAPLSGAHVAITPTNVAELKDLKSKLPYVGTTDAQGHFSLGGIEDPEGGAPAGPYTLTISTAQDTTGDETAPDPVEKVPPPHSSPGVDFQVPEDGVTDANFPLTSKK